MAEKLNYYSFGRLSPASTRLFISGDITPDAISQIEQATQAYIPFRSDVFGGVLYHSDGNGPEKPYFKPEGADWNPTVQAISRIGIQYHYWRMLDSSLREGSIDPVQMIAMSILILHMNSDGSSYVKMSSQPEGLRYVAREKGDEIARYPGYIPFVNYGGDADFYGAIKNTIFPMDVKTADGGKSSVEREKLGIPAKFVEAAWRSWRDLHDVHGSIYHEVLVAGYRELPDRVAVLIERDLKAGDKFRGEYALWRTMLKNGINDDLILRAAGAVIGDKAREVMTRNMVLHEASGNHADNLLRMYEAARGHCRKIYHY